MNQPLFSTRRRGPDGQDRVEREVRAKRHDLRDEQGKRKFGGHFFRILGARMMADAGIDKLRIMDNGRWKTLSVLERYLKGAQYKKVAEVSKKVWDELAEEFTASYTSLVDGLKDVKQLSRRVLEKPWRVRFTGSRPEMDLLVSK